MLKTINASLLAVTAFFSITAGAPAVERTVELRDLKKPLVPMEHYKGDREFGGNGPIMTASTRLVIIDEGRAIAAMIQFDAVEDGGDRSAVRGTWNKVVWRSRLGERVTRIKSRPVEQVSKRSTPGHDPMAARMTGGRKSVDGGYLNAFYAVGDTTGDDISTDSNPHGDTAVHYIDFGDLRVEMDR